MWLLETDGNAFGGKKLWLRPGKRYLFGRTPMEAGQICIPHKTISRKHLTIEIAEVLQGQGADPRSRSTVTLEDLKTKLGTQINGRSIKGEQLILSEDNNTIKLGDCDDLFRIKWNPVVISFSLSKAEIEQGAMALIQETLEPIDIKYTTDNRLVDVTYVVSKRRNTSRVLQALINGQLVVNQTFTDAIAHAVQPELNDSNGAETCRLEKDFEGNWPDATKYLPPRTDGPGADQPDAAFAPDERRKEIFDGYTFVFYERKRYEELLPVLTSAKGKALLREVFPGKTDINDFIRYVKGIAGEKGLGEFEDGSEGRGVVVVRYVPPGEDADAGWFLSFYNQVALRLDHRPIESRDLLPAILDVEPAQLRRPLEVESTPRESDNAMNIDNPPEDATVVESSPPPPPRPARRGRQRPAPKSRFKSFNVDPDSDNDDGPAEIQQQQPQSNAPVREESQGMFMTQPDDVSGPLQPLATALASQRKRHATERDIMEEVAPTAARIKRLRLEGGEDPLPAVETTAPTAEAQESPPRRGGKTKTQATVKTTKGRKSKKTAEESGDELLDQFIQAGQEEEAQRQAEDELLRRQLNEGEIDFRDIRDSMTVQPIEIRRRQGQDAEEERRWDPRWNGLKNFKKFRKQGDRQVRPQAKVIISLEPVRMKEYGIGDDYWLQNPQKQQKKGNTQSQRVSQRQGETQARTTRGQVGSATQQSVVIGSDSEAEEEDTGVNDVDASSLPDVMEMESARPARSRKGKAASRAGTQQSQMGRKQTRASTQAATGKRAALEAPAAEKPAKRRASRVTRTTQQDSDEDEDSEDGGLSFRFGKRK
ncbi:hypothetical protein M406DRAFT_347383 [Cryphonectria parasitica EP155]|uniref:FHA domain-containing protein n=1 Tax=Cryphonectria parasitica (strain ATCC 38755 / EP155) TaxID=660469 RepID=A0A9P4XWN7_CRYP1|nr:uncharacterized protein M406DRAFT_347383 [Cryphonectria parasitica EP155]KAF3762145.1 hypothetical protein M406DRAFT_347383 [Cryphonectria parasitica EP155]